jgi:broad specificity phosphatase PhoE
MTGTKTKIVLIRHGSTSMNSDGNGSADCVRGWKDLPLSADGIQEANDVAQELRNVKMDVLYPSDLDRAEHTAHIISKATGVPVRGALRGLRPGNAGTLTGKSSKTCLPVMLDHIRNKPDTPLPGGESFHDFMNRCFDCLDEIRKEHPGEVVGLVSHHRVELLIAAKLAADGDLATDEIDPNEFLKKGVSPANFVRHTLAETHAVDDDNDQALEPDSDADDAASPTPKRAPVRDPSPSRPSVPWSAKRIEPNPNGAGRGLWSQSVGGPGDGLAKKDPFDLNPQVPIKKGGRDSWRAAVFNSLLDR